MGRIIQGKPIVAVSALGEALVSAEPLSFWGGYDQHTGEITDRRHPLSGQIAAGKILALPFSRGSSTTTAVLLEAVRLGAAPLAIITTGVDIFFALASTIAGEMYQKSFAVIAVGEDEFNLLKTGDKMTISQDGVLVIE